jgi:nitrate reductase gamma subunit
MSISSPPARKQLMAIISGGIAGILGFIGVTILLARRLTDERIRATSKSSDIMILALLWLQLALGLVTLPLSAQHLDGSVMLLLAGWAQSIVTFQSDAADLLAGVSWVFKLHMFLGMTLFLVFPFTRMVHVWSGFASVAYLLRPYQLVRSRRIGTCPMGRTCRGNPAPPYKTPGCLSKRLSPTLPKSPGSIAWRSTPLTKC